MGNIALVNGNIIPMEERKRFHAILCVDGKIAAVGSNEEIKVLGTVRKGDLVYQNGLDDK